MKLLALSLIALLTGSVAQTALAQNNGKPTATINHTAIFVVDLQKSSQFYENIIGLDTIPEPFHDGKHTWLSTGPHTMLHIIQGAEQTKTYYKNTHTCFSVPSIEEFVAKLEKSHLSWEDRDGKVKAITTRVDGVKQLWLQDPDGYWIEINNDRF